MAPSMDSIPVMNEGGGIPNTKRKCPTCQNSTLIAHSVRGTEIDICKTCQGVYFDKNEFEEVFRGQDKSTSTQVAEYTALELVFQAFLALLKSPF